MARASSATPETNHSISLVQIGTFYGGWTDELTMIFSMFYDGYVWKQWISMAAFVGLPSKWFQSWIRWPVILSKNSSANDQTLHGSRLSAPKKSYKHQNQWKLIILAAYNLVHVMEKLALFYDTFKLVANCLYWFCCSYSNNDCGLVPLA